MNYKWSYYNYFIKNGNAEYIIYNTKSGAVVKGIKVNSGEADLQKNLICDLDNDVFQSLLESEIIIPEDRNEIQELKNYNCMQNNKKITLTMIPTMACNFKCPYCFVVTSADQDSAKMKKQTMEAVLKYIENTCKDSSIELCEIEWFGGEPTLALDLIEYFMRQLFKLSGKYNFLTTCTMVTNGYLLGQENFLRLYDAGVRIFQVTLDGEKENHDKYRKLSDGTGSFECIYKNLLDIRDMPEKEIQVSIRANFLLNNIEPMQTLIDLYAQDFNNDSRFSLSFRPIIDFNNCKVQHIVNKKSEARKIEFELIKRMERKGIFTQDKNRMFCLLPVPISRWCKAGDIQRFIVSINGEVFRCDSCIDELHRTGCIQADGTICADKEAQNIWDSSVFENSDICIKCKRLPICMGGCIYERQKTGQLGCHWTDQYIYDALNYIDQCN